jgi:hypothetical protein
MGCRNAADIADGGPTNPNGAKPVTALERANQQAARYFADRPSQRPSQWCVENLRFDEPGNHGPFSVDGAEYCIEPLDDWADTSITDEVLVWGSQTRKTGGVIMGGAAWSAANDPCGFMWVMPSLHLAQRFTRKRWIPLLKASPGTRDLLPRGGQARHDVKTLEQRVGAAAFTFVGSNSPANLASDPCRRVVQDEVDKFNEGTSKEADSSGLADQRTKGQPNPQRFKTSTPTIPEGLIWQEAQKGDMRRYLVPASCCGRNHPASRRVVLAWSAAYTMLPKMGCEAYVVWDKEAKRPDGSWDLDRVERSARFQCPHCGGEILDAHKTWMNRNGIWQPTQRAASGFVSRHLPSLYACAPETTVGKLAKKFLEQKKSILGLQGFINGDLAEPYQSQDRQSERVELITSKVEITAESNPIMTVDCQQTNKDGGYFFAVKRNWTSAESVGLQAVACDTWDELRQIQLAPPAVKDTCFVADSGFGARSESDVYANCARFGEFVGRLHPQKPLHLGWLPAKGFPARKRWKDEETGLMQPWILRPLDPYLGTSDAGKVEMNLFEFSGEYFKDILDALRRDKDGRYGHKWTVTEAMATESYWRHMDCEMKTATRNMKNGLVTHQWAPRSRHWPNHWFDCEVEQIAYAAFLGIFKLPE